METEGALIHFGVRGASRTPFRREKGALVLAFHSALRFALVSDRYRFRSCLALASVSIRFKVRGGFRPAVVKYADRWARFQSALRFAVVSDRETSSLDCPEWFQSALRFAVVSDLSLA